MSADLVPAVLALLTGLVVGCVSAVTPFLPAEAYVLSLAVAEPGTVALAAALGTAGGQTVGKVLLVLSVRSAAGARPWDRLLARRRRAVVAAAGTGRPAPGDDGVPPGADAAGGAGGRRSDRTRGEGPLARARRRAAPALTGARRGLAVVHRSALALLDGRAGPAVVVTSGAIGIPPLLAVAAYAGASRLGVRTFAAACLVGRAVRFTTLALVPAWAGGLLGHG
ncbi:hypothetical protein [Cellulomonas endophytica]|uniref:hypothetical protein n=1 Tax=Cellulomonas endophytica TaxID=2494735 RepID=UPI001013BC8F|nr:hypothetical protein [Cellulomonas endophytica]